MRVGDLKKTIRDGLPGMPNGFAIVRDGAEHTISELFGLPSNSKFSNVPLRKGDVFVTRQGGGGGFGPPSRRDRELVERDLREGYVTAQAAVVYGHEPARSP